MTTFKNQRHGSDPMYLLCFFFFFLSPLSDVTVSSSDFIDQSDGRRKVERLKKILTDNTMKVQKFTSLSLSSLFTLKYNKTTLGFRILIK